jgi:predicted metal-dependent HD superfamily phosphohydrolase
VTDLRRFWTGRLDDGLRERLEASYGEDHRRYHDLRHLQEVLEHVDELVGPDEPAREAVLLAAWFHDAVYDGQPDDEARSARLAEDSLEPVLGSRLAREVARLVGVTATHRPDEDDLAGQVLCDADLAILAAAPERYADYVDGVRREHAHVPDADFAIGRAAVLRDLLAKPALFHTAVARERWEARARANVEAELSSLTGG